MRFLILARLRDVLFIENLQGRVHIEAGQNVYYTTINEIHLLKLKFETSLIPHKVIAYAKPIVIVFLSFRDS